MWDEQKRSRFQQLRQRQVEDALTQAEQAELALLVRELETAEASYLTAATQRLREERDHIEAQNRTLEALALRREALAGRLGDFLAKAKEERHAIDRELATVLENGQSLGADE